MRTGGTGDARRARRRRRALPLEHLAPAARRSRVAPHERTTSVPRARHSPSRAFRVSIKQLSTTRRTVAHTSPDHILTIIPDLTSIAPPSHRPSCRPFVVQSPLASASTCRVQRSALPPVAGSRPRAAWPGYRRAGSPSLVRAARPRHRRTPGTREAPAPAARRAGARPRAGRARVASPWSARECAAARAPNAPTKRRRAPGRRSRASVVLIHVVATRLK